MSSPVRCMVSDGEKTLNLFKPNRDTRKYEIQNSQRIRIAVNGSVPYQDDVLPYNLDIMSGRNRILPFSQWLNPYIARPPIYSKSLLIINPGLDSSSFSLFTPSQSLASAEVCITRRTWDVRRSMMVLQCMHMIIHGWLRP